MKRQFLPALAIALASISMALAEPPADLRNQVTAWVKALDADTRSERYAAEQSLLSAGPRVLPLLPPPETLPNVGVREAVRRIRIRLEREKALTSVKASHVTLSDDAPLAEVLLIISQQTGNAFNIEALDAKQPQPDFSVPAEWKSQPQPFWDVVREIRRQYGLTVDFTGAHRSLQLVTPQKKATPLAEQTVEAFQIAVESVSLRPLIGDDTRQIVRVRLALVAEPRLRPLFLSLALKNMSLRHGERSLSPFNPEAKYELPLGDGGIQVATDLDFVAPRPLTAESLAFAGRLTLTIAAGTEDVVFTRLPRAEGTARRRGGVTVTLREVDLMPAAEGQHSAKFLVAVSYDTGGPAFESHRTWMFHNRVFLEDEQGRRFPRDGVFSTMLQGDGGVLVEYGFTDLPVDPAKLEFVYEAPTLITDVPIRFEFPRLPVVDASDSN